MWGPPSCCVFPKYPDGHNPAFEKEQSCRGSHETFIRFEEMKMEATAEERDEVCPVVPQSQVMSPHRRSFQGGQVRLGLVPEVQHGTEREHGQGLLSSTSA